MTILVLGDQLTRQVGPLADRPGERALLVESESFGRKLPYHPHKLTLVYSAMAHFWNRLRESGRPVDYRRVDTFEDGIAAHLSAHPGDELVVMRPPSYRGAERLRTLVERHGGSLTVVEDERFLCSPEQFDAWAGDADRYRHEEFYRFLRRETGYLMDGDEPVGGEWNFDEDNRETPPAGYEPPDPPVFEPDATTRAVHARVEETFDGSYGGSPYGGDWADPEPFRWPVTREEALETLEHFVTECLPEFGPYQDAMVRNSWALNHSLLSASLNIGLLHPAEVVERVLERRHDPAVPINSVEGFVRQVIGWREFVRHVYRREMPDLATANQLDQTEPLPDFYWTGETDMACVGDAVEGVRRRGYAHHIERLMVLSNFATLLGVEPAALNRWFHAGYVDAYHWVTTPNTVEMGSFGAGAFATKPYVASANYVDRMSDHCADCAYYKTKTTGDGACPFNTLYWDFLDRQRDRLSDNHRMGLVYTHLENKEDAELAAIRERADELRERARRGDL